MNQVLRKRIFLLVKSNISVREEYNFVKALPGFVPIIQIPLETYLLLLEHRLLRQGRYINLIQLGE
ncbi:Uncharacterised protein [Legionella pneumophila]|nr:Uncharacterised protein [Legionella pneumophila]